MSHSQLFPHFPAIRYGITLSIINAAQIESRKFVKSTVSLFCVTSEKRCDNVTLCSAINLLPF